MQTETMSKLFLELSQFLPDTKTAREIDLEKRLAAAEADAARYRYLKASGAFRTSLPDMSGKHTWSGVGRPIGVGYTIDDAIDEAKENI